MEKINLQTHYAKYIFLMELNFIRVGLHKTINQNLELLYNYLKANYIKQSMSVHFRQAIYWYIFFYLKKLFEKKKFFVLFQIIIIFIFKNNFFIDSSFMIWK